MISAGLRELYMASDSLTLLSKLHSYWNESEHFWCVLAGHTWQATLGRPHLAGHLLDSPETK